MFAFAAQCPAAAEFIRRLVYMRLVSLVLVMTALVLITSCSGMRTQHYEVTLKSGAPAESLSQLRLLSVDADGTAHIERPDTGQVYAVRPHTATNHIAAWALEDTDPLAQTARLSATAVISGYWLP